MAFPKKCINEYLKKVKLITPRLSAYFNAPYLMLAYLMLAYLMLFAVLFNAVCLYNAYSLPLIFANAFHFQALPWVIDTVWLFQILFCITHSALICWSSKFYVNIVF